MRFNLKSIYFKNLWWVFLGLLLIPSVWALFVPGFFGASDDLHVAWLFEMDKIIKYGQIPPRFVPDLSFGFGYPLFNFVFPLPFYIGFIFHSLGLSFVDSIKAVFLLSIVLSSVSMYLLFFELTGSKLISLAGSLIYTYTPYRSTDLYVRGAIGECLSFIFFPLVTLSILKLTQSSKNYLKWIGFGAISIAGLILSHNIATYMFLPFAILLSFVQILQSSNKRNSFIYILMTFFLGFLSSCYFTLPALLDSTFMKYDTVFQFIDHFPTLKQLITPYFGYGASVPGPYDGMSFFIGTINLTLTILFLFLFFKFRERLSKQLKTILFWALLVFVISIFFMNYRSSSLWYLIPLMPYFQFPWRFLMMTTFVTPLFLIILKGTKFETFFLKLLIALVLILNASFFKPHDFLGRFDDYYLRKYIPTPQTNKEYLTHQEEYLRLPKATLKRPNKLYPEAEILGGKILNLEKKNDLDMNLTTEETSSSALYINKYMFPGWIAYVDGNLTKVLTNPPLGRISLSLPPGKHSVALKFQETKLKIVWDILSLIGFMIAISLISSNYLFKTKVFARMGKQSKHV